MSETATKDTAQDPMLPQIVDGVVHIGLVLTHPLNKKDTARCQSLEAGKKLEVGDVIHVTREWGHALIEGARVQVDPQNLDAVRAALYLNKRDQPLTGKAFADAVEAYAEAATADEVTGETAAQKKIRELEDALAAANAKIAGNGPTTDAAGQTPGEDGGSDTGQKPADADPGTAAPASTEAPARGARAGKNS